jgi:transcriptional regulator with XRE-family HTH domain
MYSQAVAGLLSDLRAIQHLDRATIADRAGVTPSAASRWECGSSTPTLEVELLAYAYGANDRETAILRWLLNDDAD